MLAMGKAIFWTIGYNPNEKMVLVWICRICLGCFIFMSAKRSGCVCWIFQDIVFIFREMHAFVGGGK